MVYSNKFVMCVLVNGTPQEELANGVIKLPFGTEYALRFRNKHDRRAVVQFYVDGENVSGSGYVVRANDYVDVKRHWDKDRAFKFVSLNSPDAIDHGKNGPNEDKVKGTIEARFYLEKEKPKVRHEVVHHHHWNTWNTWPLISNPPYKYTCDMGNSSDMLSLDSGVGGTTFGSTGSTFADKSGTFADNSASYNATPAVQTEGEIAKGGSGSLADWSSANSHDYRFGGPGIQRADGRKRERRIIKGGTTCSVSNGHTQIDLSTPILKDGCTVEGYRTGQTFSTTAVDCEETYTTLKVFLQGYETPVSPMPQVPVSPMPHVVPPRKTNKDNRIDDLEDENEKLRRKIAELENEKLKQKLKELEG